MEADGTLDGSREDVCRRDEQLAPASSPCRYEQRRDQRHQYEDRPEDSALSTWASNIKHGPPVAMAQQPIQIAVATRAEAASWLLDIPIVEFSTIWTGICWVGFNNAFNFGSFHRVDKGVRAMPV